MSIRKSAYSSTSHATPKTTATLKPRRRAPRVSPRPFRMLRWAACSPPKIPARNNWMNTTPMSTPLRRRARTRSLQSRPEPPVVPGRHGPRRVAVRRNGRLDPQRCPGVLQERTLPRDPLVGEVVGSQPWGTDVNSTISRPISSNSRGHACWAEVCASPTGSVARTDPRHPRTPSTPSAARPSRRHQTPGRRSDATPCGPCGLRRIARWTCTSVATIRSGRNFRATYWPSVRSLPRYTSPIPPRPRNATIR